MDKSSRVVPAKEAKDSQQGRRAIVSLSTRISRWDSCGDNERILRKSWFEMSGHLGLLVIYLLLIVSGIVCGSRFVYAEPPPDRPFTVAWSNSGQNSGLGGAFFADARTGWVVGRGGTILATRDGGATWEAQSSGTGRDLAGVHFADARTGWVVGDHGTILATRDGGAIWEAQKSGTGENLWGVHFADAPAGWVVGKGGTILHSPPRVAG
jgi:hypothetical protein